MPSRRALLAALGSAAAVGTAGCIGRIRSVLTGYTPIEDSCDEPTGAWPTAGGDPGRTGRTDTAPPAPDAAAVDLLASVRYDNGSRYSASSLPAVGDGTAYVPALGDLVAVDLDAPTDGPVWSYDLHDNVLATPTLACGAVFAPGLNRLAALDRTSGDRFWEADADSHSENAAIAARDETIYVAGSSPAAVDVRTGTIRWGTGAGGTVALDDDDGVYTTRSDSRTGGIYAYDSNGEEQWSLSGKFVGSASVLDGTVWVADHDGSVHAIDAGTGEVYWSRSIPGVDGVDSGLAVTGDEVFVPAGTGTTSVALDAATGETIWTVDTGFVTGRPVVGDDWVAFGRTNEGVSLYERETGEERTTWSRGEYHFGTIGGLVPVEGGFLIYQFSSNRLSLLR